jgi:hypothetical protein
MPQVHDQRGGRHLGEWRRRNRETDEQELQRTRVTTELTEWPFSYGNARHLRSGRTAWVYVFAS